ncbi:cupin domain-containing protein [bacterium]|nr:cupin domain-containing protein [bacterium]
MPRNVWETSSRLRARLRITLFEKTEIPKPWGHEIIWAKTQDYVAKILYVRAGESLSLQYHQEKEETLYLESGDCRLEAGPHENALKEIPFTPGTAFHIPPGLRHRISARTDCRIFEVSTPQLQDVVRLQDRYGRT